MAENLEKIVRGQVAFELRNRVLGRLRIRPGLPSVSLARRAPALDFYRLILNRAFSPEELSGVTDVLDIGSCDGSYLPELARSCPQARVTGVEVDGGRRYWNGFRRADAGAAWADALRASGREARYFWADIRDCSRTALNISRKDMVLNTLYYPFVSEAPCSAWGLPPRYADFNSLLQALRALATTRTLLLSVHQGEWEGEIAGKAYETLGLKFESDEVQRAEFASFWPSTHSAVWHRVSLI